LMCPAFVLPAHAPGHCKRRALRPYFLTLARALEHSALRIAFAEVAVVFPDWQFLTRWLAAAPA
jgi:hypothetical protein